MNGELPEEWFRARGRDDADDVDSTRVRSSRHPLSGDQIVSDDDERFTDQFKPGWVPKESRPDPQRTTGSNPVVSAEDTGTQAATPAGSFGANSAGTTYSVGEVRREAPAPRRPQRSTRVRRAIQTGLLLGLALLVGLVGGTWLATRHGNDATSSSPTTNAAGSSAASAASAQAPYSGARKPITGVTVKADITAGSAPDSSGRQITYAASNVLDGVATTAWRCPGSATGHKLTFTLPSNTTLVGMGIVNGYTKTSSDGTDYYKRFRRVLGVTWTINGQTATQTLTDLRETEQAITIPPMVVTGPVTMTITKVSAPGETGSNDTFISSVVLYTKA